MIPQVSTSRRRSVNLICLHKVCPPALYCSVPGHLPVRFDRRSSQRLFLVASRLNIADLRVLNRYREGEMCHDHVHEIMQEYSYYPSASQPERFRGSRAGSTPALGGAKNASRGSLIWP
jgi:hypothetical protein